MMVVILNYKLIIIIMMVLILKQYLFWMAIDPNLPLSKFPDSYMIVVVAMVIMLTGAWHSTGCYNIREELSCIQIWS